MSLPNPGMDFTLNEVPPDTKFDDLVENIESLATGAGFDPNSIGADQIDYAGTGEGGIWWEEIGRTTLSGAGDTISVTGLASRKYLLILTHCIATGGTARAVLTFNGDTGANYAVRASENGAADSTAASQTGVNIGVAAANALPNFSIIEVVNVASREKIINAQGINEAATGVGTAPSRRECVAKWANTTDAINRVDLVNASGTGDFAIGSEVVILGHN